MVMSLLTRRMQPLMICLRLCVVLRGPCLRYGSRADEDPRIEYRRLLAGNLCRRMRRHVAVSVGARPLLTTFLAPSVRISRLALLTEGGSRVMSATSPLLRLEFGIDSEKRRC